MFGYWYPLALSLIGSGIIGGISGIVGSCMVLKKQSLLGDTISHASLPGIVLSLLLFRDKNPAVLMIGGAVFGALGTALAILIERTTSLAQDTILGIILSLFFGVGLVLISVVQQCQIADQAIINKFLFGNASLLLPGDIAVMCIVSCVIVGVLVMCRKELIATLFDPLFAHTSGFSLTIVNTIFSTLFVMTIVQGIQMTGIVLMSSLLIAPATAARQLSNSVGMMCLTAAIIGSFASCLGTLIAFWLRMPSGPTITILSSLLVVIALLWAPERGILWTNMRDRL